MNHGHRVEVAAALAFALPLVAGIVLSGFEGVSETLVSKVRIDLVLLGVGAVVLGGLGLLALGRGAVILGSSCSVMFGLCDIGLMVAGASALSSVVGGEVPGFAVGLGQLMMVALGFGVFAFLIHLPGSGTGGKGNRAASSKG